MIFINACWFSSTHVDCHQRLIIINKCWSSSMSDDSHQQVLIITNKYQHLLMTIDVDWWQSMLIDDRQFMMINDNLCDVSHSFVLPYFVHLTRDNLIFLCYLFNLMSSSVSFLHNTFKFCTVTTYINAIWITWTQT